MRIFLAPMEGVVDHHMRQTLTAIKPSGIDICVTEFVRVTSHLLPNKVFLKAAPELEQHANYPLRLQLLGSVPETLAENAAKAAAMGAPAIDLNFGCPSKTVNNHKGGACLLDDTSLIHDIVAAVREAVPAEIPVTAKIRLGYDDRASYLRNAEAIELAGANELVVHARSKADGYKPPAHWHYIGEIRQQLSIPVVANGEIWSLEDYQNCIEQCGRGDIMLGRGLLARPDLAYAIKQYEAGLNYELMPWAELLIHVRMFFSGTSLSYPAKHTGNRLKQWLFYLKRNFPEADALFEKIKKLRDREEILKALS